MIPRQPAYRLAALASACVLATAPALWPTAVVAQSSVLARSAPSISAMDVQTLDRLAPGRSLSFTLWGTPGADATLIIDGARSELPLVEVASGVYQGTYTIGRGEHIDAEARVAGELRHRGQLSSALLSKPLATVGTTEPLRAGLPALTHLTVTLGGDRRVGTPIHVEALGTPGAQVHAWLPGRPSRRVDLAEVRPGEYRGSYIVRPSDALDPSGRVDAHMRLGRRVATLSLDDALDSARADAACVDCGEVESIRQVNLEGEASAAGTVAGGVVGAALGSQIGKGDGRKAAGVLGAIGGALIGREIEKNARERTAYEVVVRLRSGERRTLHFDEVPTVQVGDAVRVIDGRLLAVLG